MNCKQVQNKLIFLIEGDLNSNESGIINGHLENCEDCRYLFNRLESSLAFIEKDKQTEINPFFFTRVMAGIAKQPKQNIFISWLYRKQYSIQVAVYSLLVVLAITVGHYLGKDKMTIDMESVSQKSEINDNQLFAESYQIQINEEDVYLINGNDNAE
jgi:predicted anti-sigma-YlaC factor YlaD